MSEQEMLVLSTKDRDRLKVLHEVKGKHLTQRAVVGAVMGVKPCLDLGYIRDVRPHLSQCFALGTRIGDCDIRKGKVSAVPKDVDNSLVLSPLVCWKLGYK